MVLKIEIEKKPKDEWIIRFGDLSNSELIYEPSEKELIKDIKKKLDKYKNIEGR